MSDIITRVLTCDRCGKTETLEYSRILNKDNIFCDDGKKVPYGREGFTTIQNFFAKPEVPWKSEDMPGRKLKVDLCPDCANELVKLKNKLFMDFFSGVKDE